MPAWGNCLTQPMAASCCGGRRKRLQQPQPLEDRADLHRQPGNAGIALQKKRGKRKLV